MEWSVYDLQDEFTTEEAAYLWIGKEPQYKPSERPSAVTSLMNTLRRAIKSGELSARESGGQTRRAYEDKWGRTQYVSSFDYIHYHITRNDLRQWAEKRGQHPAFLFPEHRESASASCSAPVVDWRADALNAVGASFQKSNADAANWRVDEIIKALTARRLDLQALPDGTKKSICEELCKRHPGKISDGKGGTFDKAWQSGLNAGSFRMANHDVFSGKSE